MRGSNCATGLTVETLRDSCDSKWEKLYSPLVGAVDPRSITIDTVFLSNINMWSRFSM
jgi:hypothetical protein